MALLDITLPSGSLTVPENGTPGQGFGIVGIASGLLASLDLSSLTLVGRDADLFGISQPNALGQVEIFAKQPFDFENTSQRDFEVALQASLLSSLPILGGLITLTSDPISVTVTDVNDNAPTGAIFDPAGGVLAGELGAILGTVSLLDPDTVNGLVTQIVGPDAGLLTLDGNTLKLLDTVALTVGQTIDAQVLLGDGVSPIQVTLDLNQLPLNILPDGPGVGTSGDNVIPGTNGDDNQSGLGGNDILIGSPGADTLDGGSGTDTADYSGSPAGVIVDLEAGVGYGGWAEGDRLISIENVIGSSFNDTLHGTNDSNTLVGGDGDDVLQGRGGDDVLNGGNGFDKILFRGDFQTYAITDLGTEVRITGPDGADRVIGGEQLVFANGVANYADGDGLFDSLYYYSTNLDVFTAQVDARQHYMQYGASEGGDPNRYFDTDRYLSANPDVQASGVNPLEHYRTVGRFEGRDPGLNFDVENYLARNPDVAQSGIDPLTHYLTFGITEERETINAVGKVDANGFDAQYYALQNLDVTSAGFTPAEHYQMFGRAEGRDPNAYFDAEGYLLHNQDVAQAGIDPFAHYLQFGWKEGRDPSAAFDTDLYLSTYTDVAAADVNPLLHFLQFGAAEGRVPVTDNVFG
jgi:hypothetical protein